MHLLLALRHLTLEALKHSPTPKKHISLEKSRIYQDHLRIYPGHQSTHFKHPTTSPLSSQHFLGCPKHLPTLKQQLPGEAQILPGEIKHDPSSNKNPPWAEKHNSHGTQISPKSTQAFLWSHQILLGSPIHPPGTSKKLPASPRCPLGETKHLPAHPGSIWAEQLRRLRSIGKNVHGARKHLLRPPGISGQHPSISSAHTSTSSEFSGPFRLALRFSPCSVTHSPPSPALLCPLLPAARGFHPDWGLPAPRGPLSQLGCRVTAPL